MTLEYLKGKIHMAVVTYANPTYDGSLTLDMDLIESAGLQRYQKILVANASNGSRFETYIIEGERGSGVVGLNGAAALRANRATRSSSWHFVVSRLKRRRSTSRRSFMSAQETGRSSVFRLKQERLESSPHAEGASKRG